MSRHGHKLTFDDANQAICPESAFVYKRAGEVVHCLSLDEEAFVGMNSLEAFNPTSPSSRSHEQPIILENF